MPTELPQILTPDEIAKSLRSTPDSVFREFESGRLRGFQIGGEWRTTLQQLLHFIGLPEIPGPVSSRADGATATNDIVLRGIEIEWRKTSPFSHRWPTRADEPDFVEEYPDAVEGLVSKNDRVSRNKRLLIGFTTREAAGMTDRRRATVFFVRTDARSDTRTLYPLVEFAGANDYQTSRRLASIIKLSDRTQLNPEGPIPAEYRGCETAVYSSVVSGPYASNGLAVVVREDDFAGMARHALVRLRWSRIGRDEEFDA